MTRRLCAACCLALLLACASAFAQAPAAAPPKLTTLCIGLPECDPNAPTEPGPSPLDPAREALSRGDHALALALLTPLAEKPAPDPTARQAAEARAEACYRLGDLFYKGQGTALDYPAAARLYERAAAVPGTSWAADARFNLGIMYALGQGVPRDQVLAYMWYELGVEAGSDLALEDRNLMALRMDPADVARAKELARQWLARHKS